LRLCRDNKIVSLVAREHELAYGVSQLMLLLEDSDTVSLHLVIVFNRARGVSGVSRRKHDVVEGGRSEVKSGESDLGARFEGRESSKQPTGM
jgi:hypothetical protein